MILKLSNKENTYTFTVDDLNNGEKLYYKFQIPASDVVDGKYNMVLMDDDGNIITEEQVCMGYFNAETIQYNRGENVYINSPLTANIEDALNITIDVPNYTIYPSEGYDAIKEVVVDAQPVYDNGYYQGSTDGYDTGYVDGEYIGFNNGYTAGETTQKDKLTGITITENGTYSREDGYNKVVVDIIPEPVITFPLDVTLTENGTYNYDPTEYGDGYSSVKVIVDVPDLNGDYNEGYDAGKVDGYNSGYTAGIDYASENAEEIAAANAIDLVATEFGTYYTKYSENIVNPNPVTGIYPDGETFHNLATVTNNIYNTGIIPNETTKLEFWFIPNIVVYTNSIVILTNTNSIYYDNFGVYQQTTGNQSYYAKIGGNTINFKLGDNNLYHIILSVADGLIINGEQIGTFNSSSSFNTPLYINGTSFNTQSSANGDFGMIKITQDGVTNVIIPTEGGFKNITTDEMLEVVYNEGTYEYINNDPIILDNLIKSVDVQPKIDVAKYGLKFAYSTFSTLPEWTDFSNVIDMSYMFESCDYLQSISELDTRKVINMRYMFDGCGSLQSISELDTRNVTDMDRMFFSCSNLTTLPQLDVSKVASIGNYFRAAGDRLTDVGGWKNLIIDWNDIYGLARCPNLTYQSCINILNGLADVTELGGRTLKVHPNFLTTVGDEISIGTNKGWTITA